MLARRVAVADSVKLAIAFPTRISVDSIGIRDHVSAARYLSAP